LTIAVELHPENTMFSLHTVVAESSFNLNIALNGNPGGELALLSVNQTTGKRLEVHASLDECVAGLQCQAAAVDVNWSLSFETLHFYLCSWSDWGALTISSEGHTDIGPNVEHIHLDVGLSERVELNIKQ